MPFNGDFIKRHAEAVSLFEDVQVIYVVRDIKGDVTKDVFIEESVKGGLSEKIIYYFIPSTGLAVLDKYVSEKQYRKIYKKAVKDYMANSGTPDMAHVHVGMKAGVIAQWLKNETNVPYLISEHWSGFLNEASYRFSQQPFYIRTLWNKVIKGASGFSAVSKYLANGVQKQFSLKQVRIVPNVVDTNIFYPGATIKDEPRFIHISSLEELKNPAGIIKAIAIVKNTYPSVVLDIVGPENKQLREFVIAMQLEQNIQFHKEVPQPQLAEFIRQSIALILYSGYETFGCVIIEANACGIPAIVSNIPVFHETVEEGINGSFAKADDYNALEDTIIKMIKNRSTYDHTALAKNTSSTYSYEIVGKKFSLWYSEILNSI